MMTEQKYVFRRATEHGFPLNLQVVPTGDVPLRDYDGWYASFNRVITYYSNAAPTTKFRKHERAILDTISAIESVCNAHEPDPFLGEYTILPLVKAFENLLNYETGRLDPGRGELHSHVIERVREFGIDPETGEYIKGEA